jgi:hypothetical protein
VQSPFAAPKGRLYVDTGRPWEEFEWIEKEPHTVIRPVWGPADDGVLLCAVLVGRVTAADYLQVNEVKKPAFLGSKESAVFVKPLIVQGRWLFAIGDSEIPSHAGARFASLKISSDLVWTGAGV